MILIAAWRATIANSKPRASGDDPVKPIFRINFFR